MDIEKMLTECSKREIAGAAIRLKRRLRQCQDRLRAARQDAGRLAEMCTAIVEDPAFDGTRYHLAAAVALQLHHELVSGES